MDISNLFDVSGKVALVTGGSRGIGAMIAEGLLCAGATVYVCARKTDELTATTERLAAFGTCHPIVADLSGEAGCKAVAERIGSAEDALHILVNNAGAAWTEPLDDFPRAAFERVLSVNLTAPFELTRLCLPLLRRAVRPEDPARVINIASVGGIAPPAGDGYAYSASKGGLVMLTRHLAARLACEGVTVNAVAPGVFHSRMTKPFFAADGGHPWSIPLERVGEMADIAGAVIYLSSRAGAYLTGAILPVSGGLGVAEPTGSPRS